MIGNLNDVVLDEVDFVLAGDGEIVGAWGVWPVGDLDVLDFYIENGFFADDDGAAGEGDFNGWALRGESCRCAERDEKGGELLKKSHREWLKLNCELPILFGTAEGPAHATRRFAAEVGIFF